MNIDHVLKYSNKPEIYEPGNAVMWTDPYISQQLLQVHLNEHVDLASRKPETIRKTIDWILSHTNKEKLSILDLGCGPGLYSEKLAEKGHEVTGVDFSANSIAYAKEQADNKQLNIRYLVQDYTQLDLPSNEFDLVLLVFTDFGPLPPAGREQLLMNIRQVLKPGGLFIFDVINDSNIKSKLSPKTWEASAQGFWSDQPYLALSESFLFENEKVILYQHIVAKAADTKIYRFWNHFFSHTDLSEILKRHNFIDISFHENVIPGGENYRSDEITFCVSGKN
jgi:SAM-dependent methyltransferase